MDGVTEIVGVTDGVLDGVLEGVLLGVTDTQIFTAVTLANPVPSSSSIVYTVVPLDRNKELGLPNI